MAGAVSGEAQTSTPAQPGAPSSVHLIPDTLEQRLKPCTACHGPLGRAGPDGYYPRIAGKPSGYLYNQLVAFRDGTRHYLPMGYLLSGMPAAYLHEIADFFSNEHPAYAAPAGTSANAATLERGRLLVQEGDASLKLPACSACHGSQLQGIAPAVPGLIGLPRDYLNAQLGAWKSGRRTARAPDCMATLALRLSDTDVNAVTAWLASQPVSQNARPASRFEAPAPLECGSLLAPALP
jgi:cytochrome c553